MAIEHADSFDIYGADPSLLLDGVYADYPSNQASTLTDDPDGLSTQRVLRFGTITGGTYLRYPLLVPTDIVGMGLRMWIASLPTAQDTEVVPFEWCDINNEVLGYVAVQTTGAIKLIWNGVEVVSTNFPVVTSEAWWHLECRIDTTGEFVLKVEDRTVINKTDLDAAASVVYQVRNRAERSFSGFSTTWYMKDYVVWNDLGTDNTDFLGPVRVMNLIPNEDDGLGGWTPSVGSQGYPILDNNPPLNGEYLAATPAAISAPMAYGLTDLPDDITSVKGVLTFVRARKIDGGYGQMQVSMIGTAAAESPGADRPITAGYVYWRDVHERDPGTDAPWSRVGVNDSKIKVDRTL